MNIHLHAVSWPAEEAIALRFEQTDDLTSVLGVVAGIVACTSVVLSVQRPDAAEIEPVACYPSSTSGLCSPAEAAAFRRLRDAGREWAVCEQECTSLVIALPALVAHSRVLLTFRFDRLADGERGRAEAYADRRPFADGYFDLWQLKRLQERRCAELEDALDRSDGGVILIGQNGEVRFANEAARAVLAESDGLRWHKGGVRATNLADSVNLQIVLEHVVAAGKDGADVGQSGQIVSLNRRAGTALLALIVPSENRPVDPTDTAAIIYLADPVADPGTSLLPVCRLYGFSPVETKLVGHLAAGRSLAVAAGAMSVKEHTARGYLKNVFIKTSTSRQAEMIALLFGSLVHVKRSILSSAGFNAGRGTRRAGW